MQLVVYMPEGNWGRTVYTITMKLNFTDSQKRSLVIATIISLGFGAYFLRNFFILIAVAAILAYLFSPLYNRLHRNLSTGNSAMISLLAAALIVLIPVVLTGILTFFQINSLISSVTHWAAHTDLSSVGGKLLNTVNDLLSKIPYAHVHLTQESVLSWVSNGARTAGLWLLDILKGSFTSFFGAVTSAVMFIYVFLSLLVNKEKVVRLFTDLNPLGDEISQMYLAKMAAMVRGTVVGQFVIAICQGLAGALSIYIAGFHEAFIVIALVLTLLSIIPLGGGVIVLPIGVLIAIFGNVWGGLFVIAWHLIVTTNIDNVLRPILVPRSARLDPALMLLSVFAGIGMFGFWGIVLGPVIMVLIVTTVKVYLAVYKGVPLDNVNNLKSSNRRKIMKKFRDRFTKKLPTQAN